jgi:hypothetical protein
LIYYLLRPATNREKTFSAPSFIFVCVFSPVAGTCHIFTK